MDIIPGHDWEDLADELKKWKGTVIIIGATDSGKSTLAQYLIRKFIFQNLKVCLVDADVGQSSLGLPGTISMKTFYDERDLELLTVKTMIFTGIINPAKKMPLMIDSTRTISDLCRKCSDITLIDTTGLVSGEPGKALKIGKIRSLKPDSVIAVQREEELEHILDLIEGVRIYRIKASKAARTRSVATRTAYRMSKLETYFRKAEMDAFILYSNEVQFTYNNKPFKPHEGLFKKGILIGLNHDKETIALGILDDITDSSITFRSPIQSLKKVNKVVFGDMTV